MAKDVIIQKIDNFHMRVLADDSVTQSMYEYFKFKDPSYSENPFIKSRWDGYVRLFEKNPKKLPIGLLWYLLKFCTDRKLSFSLDSQLKESNPKEPILEWIDNQKITNDEGKLIVPYWYQKDMFVDVLTRQRKTALAATSAGKSLVAYLLGKYYVEQLDMPRKMLILVPSTGLVEQLYQDFKDYSQANGFDVDRHVHKIYAGQEKEVPDKKIFLSTWQSLFKLVKDDPSYFRQFDFWIGDECHEAKAESIQGIGKKMINACYRVGMTGTLDDIRMNKLMVESIFGKTTKYVTLKELQDAGMSAKVKIYVCKLQYSDSDKRKLYEERKEIEKARKAVKGPRKNTKKAEAFTKEVDFLLAHSGRNKLICDMAERCKGNTLVMFNYVDKHGIPLYEELVKRGNKKVFIIHGDTKTSEREEIRKTLEKEDDCILLASYGTTQRGINIKNLHNIVFASPSKSKIRVLQSLGRGVRLHKEKDFLRLYDLSDDLTWRRKKNFTWDHMFGRIEYYKKEQQPYSLIDMTVVANAL